MHAMAFRTQVLYEPVLRSCASVEAAERLQKGKLYPANYQWENWPKEA